MIAGEAYPRNDDPCYVIPAADFADGPVEVPSRACVLLFSGGLFDRVHTHFGTPPAPPEWTNPRIPFFLTEAGVAVHFPLYGSPRAACAIEQLAYCGVKTLVGVGLCGSLRDTLPIGSTVLATGAIRTDAVSHHYLPQSYPAVPSPRLRDTLKEKLGGPDLVEEVIQLSTDALYRERRREIDYWRDHGVDTIDMECATLLTVARALGLEASWVGVVSDRLAPEGHEGSIGGRDVIPLTVEIALKAIDLMKSNPWDRK